MSKREQHLELASHAMATACESYKKLLDAEREIGSRLRASLEMALDRVSELEGEREKLLRALEAFEGQRK